MNITTKGCIGNNGSVLARSGDAVINYLPLSWAMIEQGIVVIWLGMLFSSVHLIPKVHNSQLKLDSTLGPGKTYRMHVKIC
jgi:hypothetical protein